MQIKVELTTEDLIEQIGNIKPVGETNIDSVRFERQLELENILDSLVGKLLYVVAACKGFDEYSMDRAGKEAYEWLCNLRDELNDSL